MARPTPILSPSSPSGPSGPPARSEALSGNAVTALIHLYRAEMGRMTEYRARLDTTTNWAITTSALVTTFALSGAARAHGTLLFLMFLNYFFLHLEARRYSAYEASRRRVRLLERYFYPAVLGEQVEGQWIQAVVETLRHPTYPTINQLTAVSWRLRRVYLWIYAGVLVAWLSTLDLVGSTPADLVARASIGSAPGWLVCLAVGALYGWLVAVAAWPGREHPLANPYADNS